MTQDSLDEALDLIIKALYKSNIDKINKIELMINLKEYLGCVETYKEYTRILMQHQQDKRFKK